MPQPRAKVPHAQKGNRPHQMVLLTPKKRRTLIKQSEWRSTPLSREEMMVALGVTEWMMRNPGDGKVPGTTRGGEEPQTMRLTHILQSPSPSMMRQGQLLSKSSSMKPGPP